MTVKLDAKKLTRALSCNVLSADTNQAVACVSKGRAFILYLSLASLFGSEDAAQASGEAGGGGGGELATQSGYMTIYLPVLAEVDTLE